MQSNEEKHVINQGADASQGVDLDDLDSEQINVIGKGLMIPTCILPTPEPEAGRLQVLGQLEL